MIPLPAEDRELSPYTGFTRAHWEAAADGLLAAAWKWATPGAALLDLPGRPSVSGARSDGLEGYARTFLAAAFRAAGGGDPHGWLERYAAGLDAGTRTPGRDDLESWPVIGDQFARLGQPMVESASVALGLRLTRPWLWDRLDSEVRDRVAEWLRGALHRVPAANNWYLFPFTVAGFLESVGRGDAATARVRARAVELLETWYVGDGWYSDGDGRAFDHYNGWALHLYPVLDAYLAGKSTVYDARLRSHLDGFASLFGADGAPIYFGRSLTYRFAAASAVGLGAVAGRSPLSPGASRRVLSGALRYFLDRRAVDSNGLLSLGWHGPHSPTLQSYSGPASPYWASKAFVCLLAGADHPLWTDREEPAPVEGADRVIALAPGLLVQTTSTDGIARLHNHGSDNVRPDAGESATEEDPLYGRHAYSTRTGPTALGNVADNHVSVMVGGAHSVRRRIHPLGAGGDGSWGWAASWHRPVFASGPSILPGLRVESVTVAWGVHELRVHRMLAAPAGVRVEQTGWAAGADLVSTLLPLCGWTDADEVRAPQGTAFAEWVTVPRLSAPVQGTAVFAALATLSTEPAPAPITETIATADTLDVHWSDGTHTRITFDPMTVTHANV